MDAADDLTIVECNVGFKNLVKANSKLKERKALDEEDDELQDLIEASISTTDRELVEEFGESVLSVSDYENSRRRLETR